MNNFVVLSIGRNPNKFLINCIESVKKQTKKCYRHIIVDNDSDDDTEKYISMYRDNDNIEFILNKPRKYKSQNLYEIINTLEDEDIVCILDSDDEFANNDVLEILDKVYTSNTSLEYVYSNYKFSHGIIGNNTEIPNDSWNPYKGEWITGHLTTFKAKCFKNININNFLGINGEWFKMACDQALNLPILFNIWEKNKNFNKVKYINEIFYIYNFHGNQFKQRSSDSQDAKLAIHYSILLRQRGFIK